MSLKERLRHNYHELTLNAGQTYYNPEEDWAYAVVEA